MQMTRLPNALREVFPSRVFTCTKFCSSVVSVIYNTSILLSVWELFFHAKQPTVHCKRHYKAVIDEYRILLLHFGSKLIVLLFFFTVYIMKVSGNLIPVFMCVSVYIEGSTLTFSFLGALIPLSYCWPKDSKKRGPLADLRK